MQALTTLQKQIIACRQCPRLVAWREQIAREKTKRFANEEYWGKPIPSFGDPNARLLIVGLAPAAHGGNRTGRMFTGDRSGDWLFRALYKAGFANQPNSVHRHDGLKLTDCYITATLRCAPPQNKPTPEEIANCRPYLLKEIALLKNVRVILGLGKVGFDNAFSAFSELHVLNFSPRPKFAHGAEYTLNANLTLIGTFHPSQQNTFTGKLTEAMFDRIFRRVKRLLSKNVDANNPRDEQGVQKNLVAIR
ncbi:MAG: uracil-DNA glycosylase [candidate division KSB1 bacterium]|nr:uracil-DNA glycosylase [candidate division KSB1 bacterium]